MRSIFGNLVVDRETVWQADAVALADRISALLTVVRSAEAEICSLLAERLLHRSGWQVRIAADGLPEFLPPVFLDKRRKPRRNNLHQPLPFAA